MKTTLDMLTELFAKEPTYRLASVRAIQVHLPNFREDTSICKALRKLGVNPRAFSAPEFTNPKVDWEEVLVDLNKTIEKMEKNLKSVREAILLIRRLAETQSRELTS